MGHDVLCLLQGVRPSNWGVLEGFSSNRNHAADWKRGPQQTCCATIWFWPWTSERSFLALSCWIKKPRWADEILELLQAPGPFLANVNKIKILLWEPWVSKSLLPSENHLFGLKWPDFRKNLKTRHFHWSLSREGGSTQHLFESLHSSCHFITTLRRLRS